MNIVAIAVVVIIAVAFFVGMEALLALLIAWLLNSFTQLHPDFMTVFIVLIIVSLLFGGGAKARKR